MMTVPMLDGNETIGGTANLKVGDFWSWALSDILSNVTRGVFAEFLVASALGVTNEPRLEWDAVDLRYRGKSVEVKSSAYCQSWPQNELSKIIFDIGKKKPWHATTNTYHDVAQRSADCYVFCVFAEKDKGVAAKRVIDTTAWLFYVASTASIDEAFGEQKKVVLSRIESIIDPVGFGELRSTIDRTLNVA